MSDRYFVGISLPKKEEALFNHVKQTFHPNNRLTSPAHITLVPPFYWTNRQILLGQLRKLAEQFSPFTAKLEKVGSFKQPKYGTVFLAPERVAPFKQMAVSLQESILGQAERGEFQPHLTLAQKVPHEKLEEVKNQLRQMGLRLKLKVDKLTLFRFDPEDQVWCKDQSFPFQLDDQV